LPESQRTTGHPDQSDRGFGVLKLLRHTNGLTRFVNRRALMINRKLGVTDDVDEQDVRDLKLDFFLNLSGHIGVPGGLR
jgi:hypothetical protein